MYLRHFAFTRFPFETNLHADELFASAARREAETRLNHLLELRGIGLLTGEVGSGKTNNMRCARCKPTAGSQASRQARRCRAWCARQACSAANGSGSSTASSRS